MSSLTDKNQGHQNPGQNQQGQTQGKPIQQRGGGRRPPGGQAQEEAPEKR
ncbi:hypothetical protein S58_47560 [Bradyrhizobium oligotrophicum S58]|uniref:Uncharacterized protein n=1 Tax=Bradyrhizobium oligotrophicum S58 TaxID=1245469 RepID=M4ZWK5_9BRAD|nr:hypothetical protein [Bradyrhizobium oligotrophicum]BAM90735.1 hypothetical protein S58_47560 [Bradyrhizobium oligotrophicum S58]